MNPIEIIHPSWNPIVNLLFQEPLTTLKDEILPNISFQPSKEKIFKVFSMPVDNIKVVILGQDPYPKPGDATGFAFAKPYGRKYPVSLRNIVKEIENSDSENINRSGEIDLNSWTDQGVFLLNTALTVQTGKAGSHLDYWKQFTQRVISYISDVQPCIWIMWGKKAQEFMPFISYKFIVKGYNRETIEDIPINNSWNYIISAPHPAAEAYAGGKAGFFGSDCFYHTNKILQNNHQVKITW